MLVKDLLAYMADKDPEAHVEFKDVTNKRQCPANTVCMTRRASGSRKNADGEHEPIYTPILELSNKL